MSQQDTAIWGLHARIEQEPFFLKQGYIGIGWKAMGSLKSVKDRDEVKKQFRKTYPHDSDGRVNTCAGQLFRFVKEMKEGDTVVLTQKSGEKEVSIGKIASPYLFDPTKNEENPHLRKVEWLKSVPRESFSRGALYELGSILTLFQVKEYGDEILNALHDKKIEVAHDEEFPTESIDFEQQARDFVKKQLLRYEKGHGIARLFAHVLEILGYHTQVSEPGKDYGVDIVAFPDELGVRTPRIKVQCKSGDVKSSEVRDLHGTLNDDEQGILVTLGKFSPDGRQFSQSKGRVQLFDGDRFVELVLEHYEQLDSAYKALLPMKQVYVPDITLE